MHGGYAARAGSPKESMLQKIHKVMALPAAVLLLGRCSPLRVPMSTTLRPPSRMTPEVISSDLLTQKLTCWHG